MFYVKIVLSWNNPCEEVGKTFFLIDFKLNCIIEIRSEKKVSIVRAKYLKYKGKNKHNKRKTNSFLWNANWMRQIFLVILLVGRMLCTAHSRNCNQTIQIYLITSSLVLPFFLSKLNAHVCTYVCVCVHMYGCRYFNIKCLFIFHCFAHLIDWPYEIETVLNIAEFILFLWYESLKKKLQQ